LSKQHPQQKGETSSPILLVVSAAILATVAPLLLAVAAGKSATDEGVADSFAKAKVAAETRVRHC